MVVWLLLTGASGASIVETTVVTTATLVLIGIGAVVARVRSAVLVGAAFFCRRLE